MIRFCLFLFVYLWFKLHEENLQTFLLINHMFKLIVDWGNDTSYFIKKLLIFEPPCMSKWMMQAFLSGFSGGALAASSWFVEVSQAWYVDTASHVVIHVPWDQKPTTYVVILKLRSTPTQTQCSIQLLFLLSDASKSWAPTCWIATKLFTAPVAVQGRCNSLRRRLKSHLPSWNIWSHEEFDGMILIVELSG